MDVENIETYKRAEDCLTIFKIGEYKDDPTGKSLPMTKRWEGGLITIAPVPAFCNQRGSPRVITRQKDKKQNVARYGLDG